MTNYTYEPFQPEVYGGKAFLVTVEGGEPPPFMVSVAVDESEVPALVEFHLNPPPQQPYPPPGPAKPAPETTVLYDHENRLRAMEGQPPLTLVDFVDKMQK
jgi:hypothetical protein